MIGPMRELVLLIVALKRNQPVGTACVGLARPAQAHLQANRLAANMRAWTR